MTARTGPHGIEARGAFAGVAAIGGLRRGEAMALPMPAIFQVAYRRWRVGIGHAVVLPHLTSGQFVEHW